MTGLSPRGPQLPPSLGPAAPIDRRAVGIDPTTDHFGPPAPPVDHYPGVVHDKLPSGRR